MIGRNLPCVVYTCRYTKAKWRFRTHKILCFSQSTIARSLEVSNTHPDLFKYGHQLEDITGMFFTAQSYSWCCDANSDLFANNPNLKVITELWAKFRCP